MDAIRLSFDGCGINLAHASGTSERILTGSRAQWDRQYFRDACALAAAAPELLKALDTCADLLNASAAAECEKGSYGRDCFDAMQAARAAIAKATGAA